MIGWIEFICAFIVYSIEIGVFAMVLGMIYVMADDMFNKEK